MKYGNIFWGIILITLGTLFALRNFDFFFFSWRSVFRLWPLIFVFWGIAILPVKSVLKFFLTVATVVVGVIILAIHPGPSHGWFPFSDGYSIEYDYDNDSDSDDWEEDEDEYYDWKQQDFSEDFNEDVKTATLNLDAAAGDFNLKGVTSQLFEFETEGNSGPYSAVTKDVGEDKVVIDFTHKRFKGRNNLKNEVRMKLNPNPVWKMNIDVGAASFDMDLTPLKVEKIDIDGGASAIDIKVGAKYEKTYITIDAGASDIHIKVPESMACEVRTSTILSGKEFDGFIKLNRGLYQTPNFSSENGQVLIDIDAAVSGVTVDRY